MISKETPSRPRAAKKAMSRSASATGAAKTSASALSAPAKPSRKAGENATPSRPARGKPAKTASKAAPPTVTARPPRVIVLLSDGTGNSSSGLFKTNVWRLYQALDLSDPARQVAAYDDGVGTSSFKLFAMLGGAFGWGLKRNVLDLYMFLCRHYQPGDRIYLFGFSRGAFTVRVLAGLITCVGILRHDDRREDHLEFGALDVYRRYRHRFNPTGGLVKPMRIVRDWAVRLKRRMLGQPSPEAVDLHPAPEAVQGDASIRISQPQPIEFMGVWDTVAAYGMPLDELTRTVDKYIWPLSMPNRFLSGHVRRACHAVAVDDERETFHPLLWTEERHPSNGLDDDTSTSRHIDEERITQVWFTGMHSDVGGGYPDDALAHVPLAWMVDRLRAWEQKPDVMPLRLFPEACDRFRERASAWGPLHDSRRGFAGYFRYTPRKIAALCDRKEPDTLLRMAKATIRSYMQRLRMVGDETIDRVFIARPKIHESVFRRIAAGTEGYAPFTLPERYAVVMTDGSVLDTSAGAAVPPGLPVETTAQAAARYAHQEDAVWTTVWKRRVTFFATVFMSFLLVFFPFRAGFPDWLQSLLYGSADTVKRACSEPQCLIVPLLEAAKAVIPGYGDTWLQAYSERPGTFLIQLILLIGFMTLGAYLQGRIRDQMRPGWAPIAPVYAHAPVLPRGWLDGPIGWLRTHPVYVSFFRIGKYGILPFVFALIFFFAALAAVVVTLMTIGARFSYAKHIAEGKICVTDSRTEPAEIVLRTDTPCLDTRQAVAKGVTYQIRLTVTEPWFDASIPADPRGFDAKGLQILATPLLRATGEPYFRPIALVAPVNKKGRTRQAPLVFRPDDTQPAANVFIAELAAPADGRLFLFVNDALGLPGLSGLFGPKGGTASMRVCAPGATPDATRWYYLGNNCGAARVTVSARR